MIVLPANNPKITQIVYSKYIYTMWKQLKTVAT